MASPPSILEKVKSSFLKLSEAAKELNSASDELGTCIASLDEALKRLNLGITAWARICGDHDQLSGNYWYREVGYAKVHGKWGIAIATTEGNEDDPEHSESIEVWTFNDAPRNFRLEAIERIPDLIERLIEETASTAKKIAEKTSEARQLAEVLAPPKKTVPRQT